MDNVEKEPVYEHMIGAITTPGFEPETPRGLDALSTGKRRPPNLLLDEKHWHRSVYIV